LPTSDGARRNLAEEPHDFFMTLRDIAFWIRSARADAAWERLRATATPGQAFDQLYAASADPFGAALPQFRYQRRKYRALLSMLPNHPYDAVLDVGCGIGAFSRALAPHAGHVLGIDVSANAIARARAVSADYANLRFEEGDVTTLRGGAARYDLVVLADVVYYLDPLSDALVTSLAADLASLLAPGGLLLLVNHFFFGLDRPSRTTRHIHDLFRASPQLSPLAEHRRAFYLSTILQSRAPGE
jgi:SAM-dependent methyltransferase